MVDQALELQLEVGQHLRVDQLPQLLGAEQLAQEIPVQSQRRGPALGQRRVALVHVGRDPVEQQALGERGRLLRLDGDQADLAAAQVREHVAQGGHVEHVLQALPAGLQQDRERRVAGRHGQQVGGALALLPQRRARIGTAAGQQQRPRRALPEARREQGRGRERGQDELVDLPRVDQ